MLPMMETSFAKEAASPSIAKLTWLIVGLVCTGSDSTPAEPNGETTELYMLNIYSSIKEVVFIRIYLALIVFQRLNFGRLNFGEPTDSPNLPIFYPSNISPCTVD